MEAWDMRREDDATVVWRLCEHGSFDSHVRAVLDAAGQAQMDQCPGARRIVIGDAAYEAAYNALYQVVAVQGDGMRHGAVAAVEAALTKGIET